MPLSLINLSTDNQIALQKEVDLVTQFAKTMPVDMLIHLIEGVYKKFNVHVPSRMECLEKLGYKPEESIEKRYLKQILVPPPKNERALREKVTNSTLEEASKKKTNRERINTLRSAMLDAILGKDDQEYDNLVDFFEQLKDKKPALFVDICKHLAGRSEDFLQEQTITKQAPIVIVTGGPTQVNTNDSPLSLVSDQPLTQQTVLEGEVIEN